MRKIANAISSLRLDKACAALTPRGAANRLAGMISSAAGMFTYPIEYGGRTLSSITPSPAMRDRASLFLDMLNDIDTSTGYSRLIQDTSRSPADRLTALRTLTHSKAREFLRQHRD